MATGKQYKTRADGMEYISFEMNISGPPILDWGRMTDTRSIANSQTDSSLSSESEETTRSKSRRNSKDGKKINQRKLAADLLDSNGESEDEEINKLQKIIQDQAKELNDEKLASRKVQILQIMS